ncbi:MAG: hypothetical protein HY710_00600 [Candidatus Latescibacteria bacterium]|nr:hypothetical protein [Candidatus Latescibacterota bacterium]
MTLVIDLTSEVEDRLRHAAIQQGMTEEEYALQLIEDGLSMTLTTGAALIARWEQEGVLGAWADRTDIPDSAAYARTLRQQAETRAWEG